MVLLLNKLCAESFSDLKKYIPFAQAERPDMESGIFTKMTKGILQQLSFQGPKHWQNNTFLGWKHSLVYLIT